MGFYIPTSWLQAVHYYYFCIGMFSFASSVMFGAYPEYAMIFVVSYVLNSGVCWYMSWWIHKKVRQQIILNYNKYMLYHLAAAMAAVVPIMLLSSTGSGIPAIMDSVVWFNYFAFFTALIWSLGLRFDVINRLFSTYNSAVMGRAKAFAMKKRTELGTGTLVPAERFSSYKPGASDRTDSLFMDVWQNRKSPGTKARLMRLELAMAEDHSREMENRLQSLGKSSNLAESDVFIISNYQKLIEKYNKESYHYREKLEKEEAQA